MNKKKRTSYLLLLVVLIYATVAVRFFLLKDDGDTIDLTIQPVGNFKPITYTVDKEFTIRNDYRDPFLGTLPSKKKVTSVSTSKTTQAIIAIPFPEIHYMGIVADAKSNKKILSIRIDGVEYVVRIGDEVKEVRILSGNEERITVSHNGVRKTIQKPES